MMQYNDVKARHLGGGVVLFENTFDMDWAWIFNFFKKIVDQESKGMYTLTTHPHTGEESYVNRSGYYFDKKSIEEMPGRGMALHRDPDMQAIKTMAFIEEVKYQCLLKYMEIFPLVYKCIWWKSKGHISYYKKGMYLGPHSDVSSDYIYGIPEPANQLALKNVLGSIVYVTDDFIGGEHHFDYLDITYKPKKGDILMFPSNYMAAHRIFPVEQGDRYAYLGWYCHGSPIKELGEVVFDPLKDPDAAINRENLYMPFLRQDFQKYLLSQGHDEQSYAYSITMNMEQV
jgi:hypothetical protein